MKERWLPGLHKKEVGLSTAGPDPANPLVEIVTCRLCESGVMKQALIRPYKTRGGISLLALGILSLATAVLSFIGLVLLVLGAYLILARREVWRCDKCGAMVERV